MIFTSLAPKTSAAQSGLLYEGHDYGRIGPTSDYVLLMTYEWGYTYGPPLAVAPKPQVRQVIEYALSEIPSSKIFMGIPNYGYDWTLPYVRGESKAQSLSNIEALRLAGEKSGNNVQRNGADPVFQLFRAEQPRRSIRACRVVRRCTEHGFKAQAHIGIRSLRRGCMERNEVFPRALDRDEFSL